MPSPQTSLPRRLLKPLLFLIVLILGVLYGGWGYHFHKFPFDGTFEKLASADIRHTTNRFAPRSIHKRSTQKSEAKSLEELGYAEGVSKAATETGVLTHVEEIAQPGVNLYITGNAEEAGRS